MKARPACVILLPVFVTALLLCAAVRPMAAADIPPLEERAAWFQHDRFGMFVHWGVYAGIGRGEWVQDFGKIPLEEYVKLYPDFNPQKFDASQWVALAKRAGQKYIVITTKHHDGFCMFDSKLTDYSIMHTPLKRDICKELADACHEGGIKIGFYYSIMDWHHPDYTPRRKWEKDRSTEGADFKRYVEYMRGQIKELMTNYGPIAALWFDGGWERTSAEDKEQFKSIIAMARKLQPRMLVNDRANIGGDYKTPEQHIPATGIVDKQGHPMLWEVCMTMTTGHGSFPPMAWWGYDRNETIFKPTAELVHKLIDVTSKGGNFLLNVGPTPGGEIRPEEAERLDQVGEWMAKYGEAVYGTTSSPFRLLPFFGRVTCKGNRLFVLVFDWPADRRLKLPGLKTPVQRAFLMDKPRDGLTVARRQHGEMGEVVVTLPDEPSDPIASVVVLEFENSPEVEPLVLRPNAEGRLQLTAALAGIHAKHGQRATAMSKAGRTYIGNWSNPNDVVVWQFTMPAAAAYRVELDARPASKKAIGQRIAVSVGDQKLVGKITDDGVELDGQLNLPSGSQSISVKLLDAKRTGPPIVDLFGLRLVPVSQ